MNFEEYYNYLQRLSAQAKQPRQDKSPQPEQRKRIRKPLARKVFTGKKRP